MAAFSEWSGLPTVIGAVDGTHFPITKPLVHPEVAKNYYCRKGGLQFNCFLAGGVIALGVASGSAVLDPRVYRTGGDVQWHCRFLQHGVSGSCRLRESVSGYPVFRAVYMMPALGGHIGCTRSG